MSFQSPFRNMFARAGIFSEPAAEGTLSMELAMRLEGARVYDLEQPRYNGMPGLPVITPAYQYYLHRRHADTRNPEQHGPRSGASGMVIMPDHAGTHIDAICHQADYLKLHGGAEVTPGVEAPTGFAQQGAETIPPLILQGFMLDVAHFKGGALPEQYAITAADLEGAMKAQGRLLVPGGVLLVRTGYGQYWNEPARYLKAAGLAPDACRWILEKRPRAVGADNPAWDAPGVKDEATGASLFGHLELLARNGIYILENLNLEGLAADHVDNFVFIAAPLKLQGATGSPVRPLAIEIQIQGDLVQP